MLIFLLLFMSVLLIIIIIFAFPRFSPIPYFPSNRKDLDLIINALELKNNQIVYDLGAGDGMIIFAAASYTFEHKLNTQFVAVDINPVLLLIMYIRWFFHPNRKNINIVRDDMFKIEFKKYGQDNVLSLQKTFYIYISPWYIEKVIKNLKFKIKNFDIVSYMYPVKSLKKKEIKIKGIRHDIFRYNV